MKKLLLFAVALAVVAGCAGSKTVVAGGSKRPDWVSGDSVRYPRETYMLGVGLGDDAASASDRARGQIAQIFSALVSVTSEISASESTRLSGGSTQTDSAQDAAESVRTSSQKVLEGVEIVQNWQDPQTRQFYALAALDRAKAASSFRQKLSELDMELAGWESSFDSAKEKFAKAKAAANVLALLKTRDGLNADLRIIAGSGATVSDSANEQLAAYKKAIADLNITVTVKGASGQQIETGIIKALNSMGFTAKAGEPGADQDILVSASVVSGQLRKDDAGPWKWAQNTVTVALAEAATGKVFLQFDVADKQAATDLDTASARSVESAAEKTALRIQSAIQDYFGGK
ncbi:MAG: LPP20 family lipoprotein [Elusimicrobiaceae bacterium]|nr:LPP20 family lipoprotein [Elusimicrobiaceae bacterium]